MAIRELFARFSFSWDQGTLAKITAASARAEAQVRDVGRAFDGAQRAATAAVPGVTAFAPAVTGAAGAAQQSASRLATRFAGLRAAWWRVFAGNAALRPGTHLNRLGLAIGGVVNRIRSMGAAWREAFRAAPPAIQGATKQLGGFGGALGNVLGALGLFGGAMGAVFAGRMLLGSIRNTFSQVDALAKMAKQLGVSVESLQALDAAAQLSGISIEDLRVGFTTMTRNLGLFAATGKGLAKDVLKEMGQGIEEIEGRTPDQLFWQFGKAIASIEDPVRRSAFAQRIFGESGARMLSLFRGSAKDIDALKARTEALGVVFGGELAEQIESVNGEMFLAGLQFQRIKVSLLGAVAPAFMWLAGRLIHIGQAFGRLTGSSKILQASFVSGGWIAFVKLLGRLLGGVGGIKGALAKLWPTLLAIGRVLLPWIAWSLILDDIITFLTGGDSALGRFLDHVFGAGSAKAVLEDLRARWAGIVEWLKKAGEAVREWAAGTDESTRKVIAILVALGLAASTTIGRMLIQLGLLAAAWALQVVRTGAAAVAWGAAQVQAIALSGSMGAMAAAAGAAAAAIGAIWAAWDQGQKLLSEVGGWEGLLAGMQTLAGGEGLFAGIDATANAKARAERRRWDREQLVAEGGTVEREGALGRGTRAAPEPTLPGGGSSRVVALTDQRTVNVTVAGGANPAATGRAVAGAVAGAPSPVANPRALRGALVGAGRD